MQPRRRSSPLLAIGRARSHLQPAVWAPATGIRARVFRDVLADQAARSFGDDLGLTFPVTLRLPLAHIGGPAGNLFYTLYTDLYDDSRTYQVQRRGDRAA